MNFIFISPQFPRTYWNFCDRLKRNGANVLGIGDTPYDELTYELKNALTEYYKVGSMENYDEMFRAVAFYSFKYGKIDWLESNNEYWLAQDARLRKDFNITTGVNPEELMHFKSKEGMKPFYQLADVPTARYHIVTDDEKDREFIDLVGYPVIAKPNIGVGATDTYRINDDADLEHFHKVHPAEEYIMEEFIFGDIVSFDGITDSHANMVFETMTEFSPSIADIVNEARDLAYYTVGYQMPEKFREMGERTVKAFNVRSRFIHMEFFRLTKAKPGLGEVGDYVALEVNMRPAGGYTPDMYNFAHSLDVYQIWADMVMYDSTLVDLHKEKYYCAFASQRDGRPHVHGHEDIMGKYAGKIVMAERMPEILSSAMGNQMYTARLKTLDEVNEFFRYVTEEVR